MKTILILDDEPSLLRAITLYLERSGYTVAHSISAALALQQFQDFQGDLDLFIADVTMKFSSGVEVSGKLKRCNPRLKVILMSGYPIEAWTEHDAALYAELPSDSVQILQKPFSATTLLRIVEQLIGPGEYLTQAAGQQNRQTV